MLTLLHHVPINFGKQCKEIKKNFFEVRFRYIDILKKIHGFNNLDKKEQFLK